MNVPSKAAVATAAVALALAGIGCSPSSAKVGVALTPAATPTAAPTAAQAATVTPATTTVPIPTPVVLAEGEPVALRPGRYAFPSRETNPRIAITLPSGWAGNSNLVGKDFGDSGPAAPFLFVWPFDRGYKDPCADHTPVLPAAGSGPAGLLRVIAEQPGLDAGPIKDANVAGHSGKFVDYVVTAVPATCGNGHDDFWIWGSAEDQRWGASHNDSERAYAIDVNGKTSTFFTNEPVDLGARDRAELQQVLDSIEFDPAS